MADHPRIFQSPQYSWMFEQKALRLKTIPGISKVFGMTNIGRVLRDYLGIVHSPWYSWDAWILSIGWAIPGFSTLVLPGCLDTRIDWVLKDYLRIVHSPWYSWMLEQKY